MCMLLCRLHTRVVIKARDSEHKEQQADCPAGVACLRVAIISVEDSGRSFVLWSSVLPEGASFPVAVNVCGATRLQLVRRRLGCAQHRDVR